MKNNNEYKIITNGIDFKVQIKKEGNFIYKLLGSHFVWETITEPVLQTVGHPHIVDADKIFYTRKEAQDYIDIKKGLIKYTIQKASWDTFSNVSKDKIEGLQGWEPK